MKRGYTFSVKEAVCYDAIQYRGIFLCISIITCSENIFLPSYQVLLKIGSLDMSNAKIIIQPYFKTLYPSIAHKSGILLFSGQTFAFSLLICILNIALGNFSPTWGSSPNHPTWVYSSIFTIFCSSCNPYD